MSDLLRDDPNRLAKADDASRIVLQRFDDSEQQLVQPMRSKWTRLDKAFRGYWERAKTSKTTSNFSIPLIASHIESYLPRILANRPRIEVNARSQDPVEQAVAQMHRGLLFYDWERCRMPEVLLHLVKGSLIFGTGILKAYHRREMGVREVPVQRIPEEVLDRIAQVSPNVLGFRDQLLERFGEIVYEDKVVEVYNDPQVDVLDPDEFYPDPNMRSLEDPWGYVIHRRKVTIEELETAEGDDGEPLYDPEVVKQLVKIAKDQPNVLTDAEANTIHEERLQTFGPEMVPERDPFRREFTLLEETTNSTIRAVIKEFPQLPPVRNSRNPLGIKNYALFTPIPVPNELYGLSMAEMLFSLNLELNMIHNSRMDHVIAETYRMYSIIRGSSVNPKHLRWRPEGYFLVDDHDDVRERDARALPFAAYRESEELRLWAQQVSGATDPFMGLEGKGNTATEAALLSQAASSRAGLIHQILSEQCLKRLGRILIRINERYKPSQEVINILGSRFADAEAIRVDFKQIVSTVGSDREVILDVAATEPETRQFKAQRAINGIGALGQIPPEMFANPVMQSLLVELLDNFGIQRPEQLVAAMAQQVMGQAQAQAQGGAAPAEQPSQVSSFGEQLSDDQSAVAPQVRARLGQ